MDSPFTAASGLTDVAARTQECLELINSHPHDDPANVTLLIGRKGAGKSTLLENIPLSPPSYRRVVASQSSSEFQLEAEVIDEKQYFFMDTPGFLIGTEYATFHEISRGIQCIQARSRIVGILYVCKINEPITKLDRKIMKFVGALAGDYFWPRITFVTTHWTASTDVEKARFQSRLASLQDLWLPCLEKGAMSYHHGGPGNRNGQDTDNSVDWQPNSGQMGEKFKDMIRSRYNDDNCLNPLLALELYQGQQFHLTSAGRALDLPLKEALRTQDPTNNKTSQRSDEPPKSDDSSQIDYTPLINVGMKFLANLADGLLSGQTKFSFGSSSSNAIQWDPNSIDDALKRRGMDHSRPARELHALNLGIDGMPHTVAWNTRLRKAIEKKFPR